MKKCYNCGENKPYTEYYKQPRMRDGYYNMCRDCSKKYSKNRRKELLQDPKWVEKQRASDRAKYHRLKRLGLLKKVKKPTTDAKRKTNVLHKERFPEMYASYVSTVNLPKLPQGLYRHRWSYNKEHFKDYIILSIKDHNTVHRFLKYDQSFFMYRDLEGNLLDTKEKHEAYIRIVIAEN